MRAAGDEAEAEAVVISLLPGLRFRCDQGPTWVGLAREGAKRSRDRLPPLRASLRCTDRWQDERWHGLTPSMTHRRVSASARTSANRPVSASYRCDLDHTDPVSGLLQGYRNADGTTGLPCSLCSRPIDYRLPHWSKMAFRRIRPVRRDAGPDHELGQPESDACRCNQKHGRGTPEDTNMIKLLGTPARHGDCYRMLNPAPTRTVVPGKAVVSSSSRRRKIFAVVDTGRDWSLNSPPELGSQNGLGLPGNLSSKPLGHTPFGRDTAQCEQYPPLTSALSGTSSRS